MTVIKGWADFYVIVGSSAGALIGLQFVVIMLIAAGPIVRGEAQAGRAFATPSVVHFGVVLLLSAIASAPWNGMAAISALWGLLGVFGIVYILVVARRMRRQTFYQPVFEDWLFHVLLPVMAYTVLAISACVAFSRARIALFLVGGTAVMLLFVGIHNAWDAVMYYVFCGSGSKE
ncbi:MAG: hypothetical protein ABFD52_00740 [Acidobacteriota bacterium]